MCLLTYQTMNNLNLEDPLVNGIHDFFAKDEQTKPIAIIGPKKKAASLEGSKDFAKKFLIPFKTIDTKKSIYETAILNEIKKKKISLICLAGYMKLIKLAEA